MKRNAKRRRTPSTAILETASDSAELLREPEARHGTSPALAGGDVADWPRAESAGEEAVGGTVATPDQDVVDEIGRALGVEQAPDAEVRHLARASARRRSAPLRTRRDATESR
jgi:Family of unknown function (DUF6335)